MASRVRLPFPRDKLEAEAKAMFRAVVMLRPKAPVKRLAPLKVTAPGGVSSVTLKSST